MIIIINKVSYNQKTKKHNYYDNSYQYYIALCIVTYNYTLYVSTASDKAKPGNIYILKHKIGHQSPVCTSPHPYHLKTSLKNKHHSQLQTSFISAITSPISLLSFFCSNIRYGRAPSCNFTQISIFK